MSFSVSDVMEFVTENDVKFVRLAFCDLFGRLKNMAIMSDRLEEAFAKGVAFDASGVDGFESVTRSDLRLVPCPDTMTVLPWRPQHGRVVRFLCDIVRPDGTPYERDSRRILKNAVERAAAMGYECEIGLECEFYLFKTDETGDPTKIPQDEGGYLDVSPLDKGEDVRRETCLALESMGVKPFASHHEKGKGQNQIDFRYTDALRAADDFQTFKTVLKAVAARNGLFASFMPKPTSDDSGSGLHVNVSLKRDGENIFEGMSSGAGTKEAQSFIAGVLNRAADMTAILNPTYNSYQRLGSHGAPSYVTWSNQNRSQLVRIPAAKPGEERMELRSPDPSANPYLAIAFILNAGLNGLTKEELLPPPVDTNLFGAQDLKRLHLKPLPQTFEEALTAAKKSQFWKDVLDADTAKAYLCIKENELQTVERATKLWETLDELYFKSL